MSQSALKDRRSTFRKGETVYSKYSSYLFYRVKDILGKKGNNQGFKAIECTRDDIDEHIIDYYDVFKDEKLHKI